MDLFKDDADEAQPNVDETPPEELLALEKKRQAAFEKPQTVFCPNVVLGDMADRIHFFNLPRLGSYFATRLQVGEMLTGTPSSIYIRLYTHGEQKP